MDQVLFETMLNAKGSFKVKRGNWKEGEDAYRRLVGLIRSMPQRYRRVLELKFVCEWSTKEIAHHLGLKEDAVKQRVSRGRELLMEKLREEGYERESV